MACKKQKLPFGFCLNSVNFAHVPWVCPRTVNFVNVPWILGSSEFVDMPYVLTDSAYLVATGPLCPSIILANKARLIFFRPPYWPIRHALFRLSHWSIRHALKNSLSPFPETVCPTCCVRAYLAHVSQDNERHATRAFRATKNNPFSMELPKSGKSELNVCVGRDRHIFPPSNKTLCNWLHDRRWGAEKVSGMY